MPGQVVVIPARRRMDVAGAILGAGQLALQAKGQKLRAAELEERKKTGTVERAYTQALTKDIPEKRLSTNERLRIQKQAQALTGMDLMLRNISKGTAPRVLRGIAQSSYGQEWSKTTGINLTDFVGTEAGPAELLADMMAKAEQLKTKAEAAGHEIVIQAFETPEEERTQRQQDIVSRQVTGEVTPTTLGERARLERAEPAERGDVAFQIRAAQLQADEAFGEKALTFRVVGDTLVVLDSGGERVKEYPYPTEGTENQKLWSYSQTMLRFLMANPDLKFDVERDILRGWWSAPAWFTKAKMKDVLGTETKAVSWNKMTTKEQQSAREWLATRGRTGLGQLGQTGYEKRSQEELERIAKGGR